MQYEHLRAVYPPVLVEVSSVVLVINDGVGCEIGELW
jgi:hypothetical protein